MTDHALIQKIIENDSKAIHSVYKFHYRPIINFLKRKGAPKEIAEDIAQEVILNLWIRVKSNRFILQCKLQSYMFSVASNLFIKRLKKSKEHFLEIWELDIAHRLYGDLQNDVERQELQRIVQSCLDRISKRSKEILILYYFHKLDMNLIAERLKLKGANSAKSCKYKALQQFKKEITRSM